MVGRSGSGKSTLTKLIQRFYIPENGQVLIDGHDLALADPNWLRRQVGLCCRTMCCLIAVLLIISHWLILVCPSKKLFMQRN
ncbi:ATP-binding cassette domain-containing protein [Escherichia coli]